MITKTEFNNMWAEFYKVWGPNGSRTFSQTQSNTLAGIAKKYLYPAGKVRINNTLMAINENDGTAIVFAERYEGNSGAVSVNFTTVNGTAIAGTDYVAKTGALNWADGESGTKEITINVIDDLVFENNETRNFSVNISNPTGGLVLGTPTSVTIGIRDNEIFIPPQPNATLINSSNLKYLGAFRVPNHYTQEEDFSFGMNTIAYNPANNSLFITGHHDYICEISIPNIIKSNNLSDLQTAFILQPWTEVLSKLPNKLINASDGSKIGGLIVHNGKLIGTQFAYYSGAYETIGSHFVLDSLNLSIANVHGLYPLGEFPRATAGYINKIPLEWQNELGGNYLSGLAGWPILSANSSGPAAFSFNIENLVGSETNVIPVNVLLYYSVTNPLGDFTGPANPIQGGPTIVSGVIIVPDTETVLFWGATGTNYIGYGTPTTYGDLNSDGGTGPQILNGEYSFQIWAYNINDLIAVKNNEKQSWEIKPYNVWNLNIPMEVGRKRIGGITFDEVSKRLYITTLMNDNEYSYAYLPIVHVFSFDNSIVETGPRIGTLCVTPQTLIPGPITVGTLIDFVAGNVYAKTNKTITSVQFFLDEISIGNGIMYPTQNYKITFNSSSLTPGQHIIMARATDNDGLTYEKNISFNTIA